jgi:DNA modification methylase
MLKEIVDESIHCVVTSPPFFGLRDYGTAKWDGGDFRHSHDRIPARGGRGGSGSPGKQTEGSFPSDFPAAICSCGARRVDSQIGLEPTPDAYVAELVAVFREIRRVLRKDGTVFLNLGDSYASQPAGNSDETFSAKQSSNAGSVIRRTKSTITTGLKPKDLIGIPWRVAFALQADGWWLRQDIIWAKPNPMPESVTDRCTKAHEYVFLLTKAERYYFDQDAIREEHKPESIERVSRPWNGDGQRGYPGQAQLRDRGEALNTCHPNGRNKRSVWTVATQPFSEAHFATFPPALIEPCILAGCPAKACAKCGAPWVREVERETTFQGGSGKAGRSAEDANASGKWAGKQYGTNIKLGPVVSTKTLGFSPSCSCGGDTTAGTVLDPFGGAGTTRLVADRLQRNAILIELNPQYAAMARRRITDDGGMFAEAAE